MAIDQTRHEQSTEPPNLGPRGGRDLPGITDPRNEAVVDFDGARSQHRVSAVNGKDGVGLEPQGHGAPTNSRSGRWRAVRKASPPGSTARPTSPSASGSPTSAPVGPRGGSAVLSHGSGRKTAARRAPGCDRRSRTEGA